MKRFVVAAAFLTLALSATVHAQRWGDARQTGFAPYGFRVFTDSQSASLRLDVSPDDAQVFVDVKYAGHVGDFNGAFRRLTLPGGPHVVEIRKTGFTPLALDVAVFPGQSVTFSRKLRPALDSNASDVEMIPPASDADFTPTCNGPAGALRLDVTPKDADIYADGYYVGRADDFGGSQHLLLTQDRHHVVLKREGFETIEFNLTMASDRLEAYRAALTKMP